MTEIDLARVTLEAATQARVGLNESVVADYAARMRDGVQFPPIVLFSDGARYYLADGFHRVAAAQRAGAVTLAADVRPGTQDEALWFALGANRAHGCRLTAADKKHAILLALTTWPDRSGAQIAEQVGCSKMYVSVIKSGSSTTLHLPDRVTGRNGVSYPASPAAQVETRAAITAQLKAGQSVEAVRASLHVGRDVVCEIKRSLGLGVDKSRAAVSNRYQQLREMAAAGHTSRQIAAAVGMTEESCRATLKRIRVAVPADQSTRNAHHHNANRILAHMVMDAENLTGDVHLIEFDTLDRTQIAAWLRSLSASRDKLGGFIRRLMKEQQTYAQTAKSQTVESLRRADREDARGTGVGDAAGVSEGTRGSDCGGTRPE